MTGILSASSSAGRRFKSARWLHCKSIIFSDLTDMPLEGLSLRSAFRGPHGVQIASR